MHNEAMAAGAALAMVVAVALAGTLRSSRARLLAGACLVTLVAGSATLHHALRDAPVPEAEVRGRPIEVLHDGYVGSSSCRSCHAHEYDTWHASYHRTMTQKAAPETVLGDFDGVKLQVAGQDYRLERRGDQFWVDMPDPLAAPGSEAVRVQRRIVTTTGSHRMQVCWYESGYGRVTGLLPFAWQVEEKRWIPRRAAFVLPIADRVDAELGSWNYVCIKCHATNAKPRVDWDAQGLHDADTHVAEFGISCEACHGPGEAHVAANHSPLRRYAQHLGDSGDPTIVEPRRLDHVRATQVCGQCHGNFDYLFGGDERRMHDWFQNGFRYRPGDDVLRDRKLKFEGEEQFWSDGLVRVAGREYNALVGSGCFDRGEMSCLSCHAMHQPVDDPRPRAAWADDMLRPITPDRSCLQCHPKYEQDLAAHTHHAVDSEGSRCQNCHMPHTTYGLLKGVRTHRIASPSVVSSVATGRPNACNQCHLDRSLGWTAEHLHAWYGTEVPKLSADEGSLAASVLWTLKGDGAQRALMAWNFGWGPAQQASGTDWLQPYLAELLVDPYEAVRIIAERSLRTLPGHADARFDLVGTTEARAKAKQDVLTAWRQRPGAGAAAAAARAAVLLQPDGTVDEQQFTRLLAQRNHRVVHLFE